MVLHKCTKATFEVAGLELEREVVIDDSGCESSECILPLDLGVEEEVMAFVKMVKHGKVNVLTRSQARAEAELDIVDDDVVVRELEYVVGNSGQGEGVNGDLINDGGGENVWCVLEEEVLQDAGFGSSRWR